MTRTAFYGVAWSAKPDGDAGILRCGTYKSKSVIFLWTVISYRILGRNLLVPRTASLGPFIAPNRRPRGQSGDLRCQPSPEVTFTVEGEPAGKKWRPLQSTTERRAIRRFEATNSTRETDGCAAPRSPTFAEITRRSMSPPLQSSRSGHSRSRR
jgi:hypothetical protein